MATIFSHVPNGKPRTNTFNLSHQRITSTEQGVLTPILCEEVIPGDKWRCNSDVFLRLAPMLAPIMHNVNVYVHYFFVPNRIVWDEWEDFITGGRDGTASPVFPYVSFNAAGWNILAQPGSLIDHLGVQSAELPTTSTENFAISALPARGYQTIYNEFYRDQNLQDPVDFGGTGSGEVNIGSSELLTIRNRAWQKDYFTSALPFTQRGPEAIIPIEPSTNTVRLDRDNSRPVPAAGGIVRPNTPGNFNDTTQGTLDATLYTSDEARLDYTQGSLSNNAVYDPNGTLVVDSTGIGIPVNDLRATVALQAWLEKNARGGGRYFEQILSHFHVTSPDARLQRPEFLGGGKAPIAISEVLQTQETTGDSPQGNMSGHGIAAGRTNRFSYFAQEHGFIFGIVSIMPRTRYMQGVRRFFRKFDKFDYAFPTLAHLGEQEVYNYEIYTDLADGSRNLDTFGYQSRYAEYKYVPDSAHGDFRTSLRYWHMSRDFANRPLLNEQFVVADPTKRIYAVTGNEELQVDHCWCLVSNHVFVNRRLPKYGVPKLIG